MKIYYIASMKIKQTVELLFFVQFIFWNEIFSNSKNDENTALIFS